MQRAAGFAIFTVIKAGFVLSARGGSGIVIARTAEGGWSPPSAIGLGGFGFGGQMGAEVTDFLIVLNSTAAVKSFMAAGSLTLGGNLSIAVGPLGRNAEGTGAVNTKGRMASMYSYSRTKGLFGGLSIEGSIIVERQDANRLAYGGSPSAKQILSGTFDAPEWATVLVQEIERCTGLPGGRKWRSWEEEGEFGDTGMGFGGGMGGYGEDGGRGKKGRDGAGSGRHGAGPGSGGYAFGDGVGAGGADSPGLSSSALHSPGRGGPGSGNGTSTGGAYGSYSYDESAQEKEKGRKRGSSLSMMFDRSSNPNPSANYAARHAAGGGASTPPRPNLSKRTSSFNPFSKKQDDDPSSPTARRNRSGSGASAGAASQGMASSENYNAGLTWDSDGSVVSPGYGNGGVGSPTGVTPWATRSRAGSSGLRPAHWDRDRDRERETDRSSVGGMRERSYSDPKLSRTARGAGMTASLLDDDDEYGDDAAGASGGNGNSNGNGNGNGNGYTAGGSREDRGMDELSDQVAGMGMYGNGSGTGPGTGNRVRAGSGASYHSTSGINHYSPGISSALTPNRSRANSRLADSYVPDPSGSGAMVNTGTMASGSASPGRAAFGRTGSGLGGVSERDDEDRSGGMGGTAPRGGFGTGTGASSTNRTGDPFASLNNSSTSLTTGHNTSTSITSKSHTRPPTSRNGSSSPSPSLSQTPSTGYPRTIALYDLPASQPGDLALKKGQVIYALDKVGASGDWWRGMNTSGEAGIFPANYVEVVEIPREGLKGGLGRGDLKKRVPELGLEF